MFTEYKLTDEFEIVPTNDNHVSVRGETTINGVRYHVHAHLHIWPDGAFHIGLPTENSYQQNYQQLYMSRLPSDPNWKKGVSDAARKYMITWLPVQVNLWYADNADKMALAGTDDLKTKIARLEDEIAETQSELENKRLELMQMQAKLGYQKPVRPHSQS